MKKTVILTNLIGIFLIISFSLFGSVGSRQLNNINPYIIKSEYTPVEYYFKQVYVRIYGRCRTIASPGEWIGGTYKGHLRHASAIVGDHNKPPEDQEELSSLHVEIRKDKFGEKIFSCDLVVGPVGVEDATGLFYWEQLGDGVSKIPPKLYIDCYSKGRTQVHVYHGENVKNYTHARSTFFKNPIMRSFLSFNQFLFIRQLFSII